MSQNSVLYIKWDWLTSNEQTGGTTIFEYILESSSGDMRGMHEIFRGYHEAIMVGVNQDIKSYDFRIKARNIYGEGEFSELLTVGQVDYT